MSFSPAQLESQYIDISRHVDTLLGSSIVEETNKRIIVRCLEDFDARNLMLNLKREGYRSSMRKGLKTSACYVQVLLNAPF